ncbi:ABC transporter ATP-binding protein [Nostocoides sp.]
MGRPAIAPTGSGDDLVVDAVSKSVVSGFRRRQKLLLDGVQLRASCGEVHALLGPNGAGKSTLMRIILGLYSPTSGHVSFAGVSIDRVIRGSFGAALEQPRFIEQLSGRDNLAVLARGAGVPLSRVEDVVELCSISRFVNRRTRQYSTGERQSLAMAASLIHDPQVLILDEPTNGLDYDGTTRMQQLMRQLADGGKLVMVSSHKLYELEPIADSATVLQGGRVVAAGSMGQLLRAPRSVIVGFPSADDRDRAAETLTQRGWGHTAEDDDALRVTGAPSQVIVRCLAGAELFPDRVIPASTSLEEFFVTATSQNAHPSALPARQSRRRSIGVR